MKAAAAVLSLTLLAVGCSGANDSSSTLVSTTTTTSLAAGGEAAAPVSVVPVQELSSPTCKALSNPPVEIDGPLSTDADVAAQQQARAEFGFASDEGTVAEIVEAGPPDLPPDLEAVGQDMAEGLGLVLTAAEVQDTFDRQTGPIREQSSEAIIAFAELHPDTYGGRWIDQAAGGVFRVAVTGDVDAQWAELEPTLPAGHRVEMEHWEHSRVELDAHRADVDEIVDELGLQATTGVSERLGLVTVRVTSAAGPNLSELDQQLEGLPACIDPPGQPDTSEAPPPVTSGLATTGFRTHAAYLATDEMGALLIATTQEEVDGLWDQLPDLGPAPSVLENAEVFLRFTVPDDACPEIFSGLREVGGNFEVQMTPAGYEGCIQPLNPRTYVVSVDRPFQLPQGPGEVTISLPADPPFHNPTSVSVALSKGPVSSGSPVAPTVPDEELTDGRGVLELPNPGSATAALLDDGTPVFVVAHRDETVTVVDARVPTEFGKVPYNDVDENILVLTSWWGGAGRFLGAGVWDRYGRALDNGPHADLRRFAAVVRDGQVVVGQPTDVRPAGDPITDTQTYGSNVEPLLPELVQLSVALQTEPGTVSRIDATAVVRSDIGARLCVVEEGAPVGQLDACPDDAPVVEDLFQESPDGRLWTTWFHGPVLAVRTDGGFAEVVAMGGKSGSAR